MVGSSWIVLSILACHLCISLNAPPAHSVESPWSRTYIVLQGLPTHFDCLKCLPLILTPEREEKSVEAHFFDQTSSGCCYCVQCSTAKYPTLATIVLVVLSALSQSLNNTINWHKNYYSRMHDCVLQRTKHPKHQQWLEEYLSCSNFVYLLVSVLHANKYGVLFP